MDSISKQIEDFARLNKFATESEIRVKFGVTRQLVSKVFHKIFTDAELQARKDFRDELAVTAIAPFLKSGMKYADIAKNSGVSYKKTMELLETSQVLKDIIEEANAETLKKVTAISADWKANYTIPEIATKHGIQGNAFTVASHISKLRAKYGETLFPIRLHNQLKLEDKVKKFEELNSAGVEIAKICTELGYKNIASMRSALAQYKEKEETNGTVDI